jgi:hypothetical protein
MGVNKMVVEKDGDGITSRESGNMSDTNSGTVNKKRQTMPRMVPILSRRFIIALAIGLIIGVGLGIGYWALNPIINDVTSTVSEIPAASASPDSPHECTVSIQVVNPGASYMSIQDLRRRGEYYATKASTYPFFEFLSQELSEQAPDYYHTADELNEMILVRYNYNIDLPSIEARITGNSDKEALYLAGFMPHVFQNYLIEEEIEVQEEERQRVEVQIASTTEALLAAEEKLNTLELERAVDLLENDPNYIVLNAKIYALEAELNATATELSAIIVTGDTGENYETALSTLDELGEALSEARSQLAILEAQVTADSVSEDVEYLTVATTVNQLEWELANLNERLASYMTEGAWEDVVDYLAIGDPSTPSPVLPEGMRGRNAAMIGGICGVGVAWVTINRKWIFKQLSPQSDDTADEGAED